MQDEGNDQKEKECRTRIRKDHRKAEQNEKMTFVDTWPCMIPRTVTEHTKEGSNQKERRGQHQTGKVPTILIGKTKEQLMEEGED